MTQTMNDYRHQSEEDCQQFGDWSVETVWKEVPDPHKPKATIHKCKVILNYKGVEQISSNHYAALPRAVEMAKFFHEKGHVPKKIPKVLGDHGDVRGRDRWLAAQHGDKKNVRLIGERTLL